jgi:NADH dehydrogenase [ubiquinone] 1 alpha subcomplex assembly factor 3
MSLPARVRCSHMQQCSNRLRFNLHQAALRRSSSTARFQRPITLTPKYLTRSLHSTPISSASPPPRTHDRGPPSEESTQTDFGKLNVLGGIAPPASSIDTCYANGFMLSNGVSVEKAGVILVGGEVFRWMPWKSGSRLLNRAGQFELLGESVGILELLWPKPGMLFSCFGAK